MNFFKNQLIILLSFVIFITHDELYALEGGMYTLQFYTLKSFLGRKTRILH